MGRRFLRRLALGLWLPLLAGCFGSAPPDQFYMLRAMPGTGPAGQALPGDPLIGLGPIRIPAYLDRPQIVTAISPQEFRLSERHRWAERLDVTIARVSAENLANFIPTDRLVPHPWPRDSRPAIQAAISVQEMHVDPAGVARLSALWSLRVGKGEAASRRFDCRLPASTQDYSAMVDAQSQCLARLNRDMAAAIRALAKDSKSTDPVSNNPTPEEKSP
jgi:uncharacterized lipoprotein YmbA